MRTGGGAPLMMLVSRQRLGAAVITGQHPQTRYAADVLIDHVEIATGVRLEIVSAPSPDRPTLYIGCVPAGWTHDLTGLSEDGFVRHGAADSYTIVGGSPWGDRFGVLDFLESHVGVRWLMRDIDGADGRHVPRLPKVSLPAETVRSEPAFTSRVLHPFPWARPPWSVWDYGWDDGIREFGQYLRTRQLLDYNHRLWEWVPPGRFATPESREFTPDFYPIRDGATALPTAELRHHWQPRFRASDLPRVVADAILERHEQEPETRSYSLSMNDYGGFSEDDLDRTALNHFRMPSASASYYAFVNDVAERVTAVHPGLRFALLAYMEVADPPVGPLHPNVVPYLTKDTGTWVDTATRDRDWAWLDRWSQVTNELGWWDYRYGHPFQVPRVQLHHDQRSWQHLHEAGVRHMMVESSPAWGEGPKLHVLSKLLWDPWVDVDTTAQEWCDAAVGAAAGPHLREYYRVWERFWDTVAPHGDWGRGRAPIYPFDSVEYLAEVPEDTLRDAMSAVERAHAAVATREQQARLMALDRYFDYYRLNAATLPRTVALPRDEEAAVRLARLTASTLSDSRDRARRRLELADGMLPAPDLHRYRLRWSGWPAGAAWSLAEHFRKHREGALDTELGDGVFARVVRSVAARGANSALVGWTVQPAARVGGVAGRAAGDGGVHVPGGANCIIEHVTEPAQEGFVRAAATLRTTASGDVHGYSCRLSVDVEDETGELVHRTQRQWPLPALNEEITVEIADLVVAGRIHVELNVQTGDVATDISPLELVHVSIDHGVKPL